MGIRTGIIPIPRTTTAASAFGVDEPQLLGSDMTVLRGMSGCVGMCRDVSGCACSIDGHDLYLRLRDLNQHESTGVSIGLTFTENWAETARVA